MGSLFPGFGTPTSAPQEKYGDALRVVTKGPIREDGALLIDIDFAEPVPNGGRTTASETNHSFS
jgi:hypothetical protein